MAEVATKSPRVTVSKDTRRALLTTWQTLTDHYGPHIYPNEKGLLDYVVFAVLMPRAPVTNVRKSMRALREAYVDWNEVRVATVRELSEVLAQCRVPGAFEAAAALRQTLHVLFHTIYGFDLSVLNGEDQEAAQRAQKRLGGAEGLCGAIKEYLLLLTQAESTPPLGAETSRVLERVGVFRSGDTEAKQRKILATVNRVEDALRLHHVFAEHARKACTAQRPRCKRCPIADACAYAAAEPAAVAKRSRATRSAKGRAAAKKAASKPAAAPRKAAKRAPRKTSKGSR